MNTLNKDTTKTFFKTETGFTDLEKHWSFLVNSDNKHSLKSAHHLLYAVLRGKDWRKGFILPTNEIKVNNGGMCCKGYYSTYYTVMSKYSREDLLAPFKDLISDEAIDLVIKLLPKPDLKYKSETAPTYTLPESAYLDIKKEN